MTYIFKVLGTPQGQGRPRFLKTGRTYIDAKTKAYRDTIISSALQPLGTSRNPFKVEIIAYFELPASWPKWKKEAYLNRVHCFKPDGDNIAKAVLDALNGYYWYDDSQVCELTITKLYSKEPHLLVSVTELDALPKRKDEYERLIKAQLYGE